MKLVLSYILSAFYYLFFGLVLVVFHGIQWTCHRVFGYQAHKKSVDILNLLLLRCLHFLGGRVSFENEYESELTKNQPHIIVANHQSMYDIPPLVWNFRKLHPKFISKVELGKGIPSISYNLRHGGSVLIDRKNPRQSLPAIKKFTHYLNETHNAAVIFPEGTRSRTGQPKQFSANGLLMLFKNCPEAKIIPVSINNSWKLQKKGSFPLGVGVHIKMKVQKPILVKDFTPQELVEKVENSIIKDIKVIAKNK